MNVTITPVMVTFFYLFRGNPMRTQMAFLVISACILSLFLSCDRGAEDSSKFLRTHYGHNLSVKIADAIPSKVENIQAGIQEVLDRINSRMSTYQGQSEISRFNRYTKTDWFAVSKETARVIEHALLISAKTNGVFDITVGPLVNIWGFGPDKVTAIPGDEKIQAAKARTGYHKLKIDLVNNRIKKEQAGIYLDLSAIAKGYAVDAVAEYLSSQKIENFMVEVGGEIRVQGTKAHGRKWQIAIESPLVNARKIQKVLALENLAMATSGDYRNFRYKQDGTRFSHTIDPRTGKPITHNLASVSVFADTCMHADAMATALMVLGESEGYRLAESQNLACYFIIRKQDEFEIRSTSKFRALFN